MKKIISLCLALALIMSLSIPAYATGTITTAGGSASTDVYAEYEGGTVGGTRYKVEISWGDLNFKYNEGTEKVWNTNTLQYEGEETPGGWDGTGSITVTNYSNTNLTVTPAYEAETGYDAVDMTFSNNPLHVTTAETGIAETATMTVVPTGTMTNVTESTNIGTITLTIGDYTVPDDATIESDCSKVRDTVSMWYLNVDAGSINIPTSELGELDNLQRAADSAHGYYTNGDDISVYERDKAYIAMMNKYNAIKTLYNY